MEYKGYLINPSPRGPKCYSISTSGRGGKIPDIMLGDFTSKSIAIQLIDAYLEIKDKKGKTDGEESSKG